MQHDLGVMDAADNNLLQTSTCLPNEEPHHDLHHRSVTLSPRFEFPEFWANPQTD